MADIHRSGMLSIVMEMTHMSNQDLPSEIGTPTRTSIYGEAALREQVSKALKGCSKRITREEVAQELTTMTGHKITKGMLDDWATPSKEGLRVPAFLIKPLCEITNSDDLAVSVMPFRAVFTIMLGNWVFQSRRTLDRIYQDLHRLTDKKDQKTGKKKSNKARKA